jgi:hypothetical protein
LFFWFRHLVSPFFVRYSSLTFSIQSADMPSSFSTMAMWVMARRHANAFHPAQTEQNHQGGFPRPGRPNAVLDRDPL